MNNENTNSNSGDAPTTPPLPPQQEIKALPAGKLPPELLEWALQMYSEEEIIAGLEEIEKTGGLQFSDFLNELEKAAHD